MCVCVRWLAFSDSEEVCVCVYVCACVFGGLRFHIWRTCVCVCVYVHACTPMHAHAQANAQRHANAAKGQLWHMAYAVTYAAHVRRTPYAPIVDERD